MHSHRPGSEQATVSRPAEHRPGSGRWSRPQREVSALALKRQLGLRSYETAWTMLHKLRVAKRPGRDDDRLQGYVEVDETLVRRITAGI